MKRRHRVAVWRTAIIFLIVALVAGLDITHRACIADYGESSRMCVD